MLNFLKILARNLQQGPVTESFPVGEAPTPQRLRGRVELNPGKCVGCKMCTHVCPGAAIRIENNAESTAYNFTVWHNTCCLCGLCEHYCPTQAITVTNNWHNTHEQSEKYDFAEHHVIPYKKCSQCEKLIRFLPPAIATHIYAHSPVDMQKIIHLCPSCRQLATIARKGAPDANGHK